MEALAAAERRVGFPLPDPAVQPESGLANRLACVLVDFVGLDDALVVVRVQEHVGRLACDQALLVDGEFVTPPVEDVVIACLGFLAVVGEPVAVGDALEDEAAVLAGRGRGIVRYLARRVLGPHVPLRACIVDKLAIDQLGLLEQYERGGRVGRLEHGTRHLYLLACV